MKTALVIGGTGLVGSALIQQLLENPEYIEVISLHRRKIGIKHDKFTEYLVDFEDLSKDAKYFQGDVMFSSMGTTIKAAGSQDAQYKIDHDYPLEAAKVAMSQGVKEFVLVSSAGANHKSRSFYTRIKGELEVAVKQLGFEKVRIIQPSFLDGKRKEFRMGEKLGIVIFKAISWIPIIKNFRPIHVDIVARAMQQSLKEEGQVNTYALQSIFDLADKTNH